ncbi:Anti-silencing function protein 1, partial [Intoshia linei]
MSKVNVVNVSVMDKEADFTSPFKLEITFDCIEYISQDLEWKLIYVGSAEAPDYDQVLDSVLVGPIEPGKHMFIFEANAPNPDIIPQDDIIGVTVLLLTCSFGKHEFVRIGYYVNNEYADQNYVENPPPVVDIYKLKRSIMVEAPRVTRFKINWDQTSQNDENVYDEDQIMEDNIEPHQETESFIIKEDSSEDEDEAESEEEDDESEHSVIDLENEESISEYEENINELKQKNSSPIEEPSSKKIKIKDSIPENIKYDNLPD